MVEVPPRGPQGSARAEEAPASVEHMFEGMRVEVGIVVGQRVLLGNGELVPAALGDTMVEGMVESWE